MMSCSHVLNWRPILFARQPRSPHGNFVSRTLAKPGGVSLPPRIGEFSFLLVGLLLVRFLTASLERCAHMVSSRTPHLNGRPSRCLQLRRGKSAEEPHQSIMCVATQLCCCALCWLGALKSRAWGVDCPFNAREYMVKCVDHPPVTDTPKQSLERIYSVLIVLLWSSHPASC